MADRFADWRKWPARGLLLAFLLAVIAGALVPIHAGKSSIKTRNLVEQIAGGHHKPAERKRDADLALYDRAIARIAKGENYYDFLVAEQRRAHYPVRPGFAVRLPTLAYLAAWLGEPGLLVASVVLMLGVLIAWWRRLGEEPGGRRHRPLAMALLFFGASLGLNRYYFVLHELWAGMLLALAFGLHRPGKRWGAALAVAALALAIREHALPFVLLMAGMAFWRRDWREGMAWTGLVAVFVAVLAYHFHLVAEQVLPGDRQSAPWLVGRGLSGWLSNVVLASNMRYLPRHLAGALVVLTMLGWAGWRSPAGVFGFWLFAGYGVAFMLAGRWDNFYWGATIAPAMFIGFAFVPRALASLAGAALARPWPLLHKRQP
ncbi:MAG: DUF2079 domain-containing protein [Novosphingobium sp.]